ncbi:hypothetical protein R1sor_001778 [Riccia sorocarpa]|uniref:R2R3-MYB transcription factor n=1 Tax=Riccia sorocarpa TaxID=122646 RepID=A0ABD3H138_9MARC
MDEQNDDVNTHIRGRWTEAEDKVLIEAHKKYGNRWTKISRLLSDRTNNAVKNRYSLLWRREARNFLKLAKQGRDAEPPTSPPSNRHDSNRPKRKAKQQSKAAELQSVEEDLGLHSAKENRHERQTKGRRLIISERSLHYASNTDNVINPLQQQNRPASCEAGLRVTQYERAIYRFNLPGESDHDGTSRSLFSPIIANTGFLRPALCEAMFAVPQFEPAGMRNLGPQQFGSQIRIDSGFWSPSSSSVLCETLFAASELSTGMRNSAPEYPMAPCPLKQWGSHLVEQSTTEHITHVTENIALQVNAGPCTEETRDSDFNEADFDDLLRFLGFE